MTTAVYLCREGANEELRFSLRSLRNLPIDDVVLVGGRPAWYTGEFIPSTQAGTKYERTERAMTTACTSAAISDEFVLFNDDFYVMEEGPLPAPMHQGPIVDVIKGYEARGLGGSEYIAFMRLTLDLLRAHGISEPLSYELHIPMLVDKVGMLFATSESGQQRSMYGNLMAIGGEQVTDVKVYSRSDAVPTGRWLSSRDSSLRFLRGLLQRRFPEPSPWEAL